MTSRKSILGAALVLLACAGTGAQAQDHGGPDRPGPERGGERSADRGTDRAASTRGPAPAAAPDRGGRGPAAGPNWGGPGRASGHVDFDRRYNHNHYYPSRGFVYGSLPYGALSVGFGGGNYFFHGGVWFRPDSGRYVVVQPPFGIFIPVLPTDYATVWVGSVPYYYADDVYYNAAPGQGYVVVAPPPGAETLQPAPAPVAAAAPDPIYYGRTNQSAAQTEADRRDCNTWATSQPNAMADSRVFQRAVDACMDGRGYTVR